jgi:class 3 adenylate cyclase/tetratricopeptide (TPR) repeat protein
MFCDMVGSSALSTRLDAEEQREVVSAFQSCCAAEIKRLDGMVAQYLGDGVLAYFGYPVAHEDDAERAVRAGLAIIPAIAKLDPAPGVRLQSRIGVASGVVVIGDLVREDVTQENAAVGETTNLAARLQALAEPDTLIIAPDTHRLVGALFEYRDLGPQALKGFGQPVRVCQVLHASTVENRFEAHHQEGMAPLLGREEELELLLRRWQQAKAGEGRVVLITGEPGIGKSRLTQALRERLAAVPHTRLVYHCSPYHQDSALYPVTRQLVRAAGIERDDSADARLDKLETLLTQSSSRPREDLPIFAALLSIPGGARAPLPRSTPQQLKERTLLAILAHLRTQAVAGPVLLVMEDLHWVDPTTLELVGRIVEQASALHLLVLLTARPEFSAPWPNHRHVSAMALSRLDRAEGERLVAGLTRGKALPAEVLQQIVARTDGVPLFIEELTKTVLESGLLREMGASYELAAPLPPLAIPSTLHASLLARLDRLASVKDVAQIGAAIGREFSYRLLATVAGLEERELRAALARLVEAGLVFQRGEPPEATYVFKHALVQDAAYASMVKSRRQQLHGKIAHVLERDFPELAATEAEALARHFSAAQQPDRAVGYWLAAGGRALQRSANREAITHLSAGLGQLEQLPDTGERRKQELALQRLLGQAYFHVKGLGAAETERAFNRARELCAASDDDLSIIPVLQGIIIIEWGASQWLKAEKTGDEILLRARRTGDTGACLVADFNVASNRMHLGRPTQAWRFFDRGIAAYRQIDAATALRAAHTYFLEPGSFLYSYAAHCQWLLGNPDKAVALGNEAIAAGERVRHDYSLSRALYLNSILHAFRREWKLVEDYAARSIVLAQEHGLGMMVAVAGIMREVARGNVPGQGNAADIRHAITGYRATGTRIQLTVHLALFAQVLWARGQYEEGMAVLREAMDLVEKTGERLVEAEIYRLNGDLLQAYKGPEEAEASYRRALDVAREQQAKAFELRAATSLARLWGDQGRHTEARDLLCAVYACFREGFDTADLKEAKALLEKLA